EKRGERERAHARRGAPKKRASRDRRASVVELSGPRPQVTFGDHAWLQIEIRDRDGEVEGSISRDGLVQVEEDARDRRPGGDLDRLRAIGLRRLSHREKLRSALGIRGPGGAMSLEEIGEDR